MKKLYNAELIAMVNKKGTYFLKDENKNIDYDYWNLTFLDKNGNVHTCKYDMTIPYGTYNKVPTDVKLLVHTNYFVCIITDKFKKERLYAIQQWNDKKD